MSKERSYTYRAQDSRFKLFHELMLEKVEHILLVASTYDAWMMEEDCRLSERIINEYRGMNLSRPPKLDWVSSSDDAIEALAKKKFDLVITMTGSVDDRILQLGSRLKRQCPLLPSVLLCHNKSSLYGYQKSNLKQGVGFDYTFYWSGNTDLLFALIKCVEDHKNVVHDTRHAGIRVILLVEDSPIYISSLLPILYRELVVQVQSVMEEGLNEEHRLMTMRARPKILVATSYEHALFLYKKFQPYILGVISDVRFPCNGCLDNRAGVQLLKQIQTERFDIPLLMISSEPSISETAAKIPAAFISKNSATLLDEIHSFVLKQLGFGPFVFKSSDGGEIARASNLRTLERLIANISQDALVKHCNRNDFSRWFYARAEFELANKVRPVNSNSFAGIENRRRNLLKLIRNRIVQRQKGLIVNFKTNTQYMDADFFKIGNGSLGGKARGLAFVASLLSRDTTFRESFPSIHISIPQTLVITTDGFDEFISINQLKDVPKSDLSDIHIAQRFLQTKLPNWITEKLEAYLQKVHYPLAVRSSGLLEDAQSHSYAGLYHTYMLPNSDPNLQVRLSQLLQAVKLVYASTYFESPKKFAHRVGHRTEEERMAVIIQQLIGRDQGKYYYPAVSGVAQSYNYYPFSKMKPEEGIVTIVAGLGKGVVQGKHSLRFSPYYPQLFDQRSNINDILKNAQSTFYALKLKDEPFDLSIDEDITLKERQVAQAVREEGLNMLCGRYIPDENRLRESGTGKGYPVLTFANILKYNVFPLSEILKKLLSMGHQAMGCPVEIEFSVNLGKESNNQPDFAILQLRPMSARQEQNSVKISSIEKKNAFCYSSRALGNADHKQIADIIFVKPNIFDVSYTVEMAEEINQINSTFVRSKHKYLLIGPGRWGSADRWLGIPIRWSQISSVGAIIEAGLPQLSAELSQGSHFFHNLTSLGIPYLNIGDNNGDHLHWNWLECLPKVTESRFIAHARLSIPLNLKVDGQTSQAVVLFPSG